MALISANGGLIACIVGVALALNFLLSGISKFLESFMDKTSSTLDNSADSFILKILSVLKVVIDWGSANRSNPAPAVPVVSAPVVAPQDPAAK